jgi:pimeloyl-ACP methyl ester carboxylesterase
MPTTLTGGRRTRYERSGSRGPSITLVHGGFVDATAWRPFDRELAAFADVLAYDVRGYGGSPAAGARWSLESCAQDLLALWDAIDVARGWILGFSQGGLIAQLAALAAPERVRGLVLVSTTARFGDEARARFAERGPTLDRAALPAELERHLSAAFSPSFAEEQPGALERYRGIIARVEPGTVANAMAELARADLTAALGEIRCPVLVVRGAEDPIISEEYVAGLRAGLGDCTAVTVGGAGHNVPLERPAELAKAVRRFVTGYEEAAAP